MISETDFVMITDRVLAAIASALDAAAEAGDADIDWTRHDGILEIECADGSKLIVNRHVPNREIWVAARAGGYHFAAIGGLWQDTRSGDELGATIATLVRNQAGVEVALPALAA